MAILREEIPQTAEAPRSVRFTLNNGDLAALEKATERLEFKDEQSLLRYALGLFTKAATSKIIITETNGSNSTYLPIDALLKQSQESQLSN